MYEYVKGRKFPIQWTYQGKVKTKTDTQVEARDNIELMGKYGK